MRRSRPLMLALLLCAAAAAVLRAQEPLPFPALPDSAARRAILLANAANTTRLSGGATIPRGSSIDGDVVALGGAVSVAGIINGTLVVINGDLSFEAGARVSGDVLVVGGDITGDSIASIGGRVERHPEPLRYREHPDGMLSLDEPPSDVLSAGRDFPFGRTDLLLAARNGYNRVEGLPIQAGPRIRLGNRNPTYLDAFLIYRTATGLDDLAVDRLGYAVRVEQAIGGRNTFRVGGRIYSEIEPIELALSNRENSLSTFVLHRDFRDSYEVDGWAAYLRFVRPSRTSTFTLEYADERHRSTAPADPWSLFRGDEAWRPNPVVAEGELRTLRAAFAYDTRNEEVDPSAGWDIRVMLEQGLGGDLFAPGDVETDDPDAPFSTQERERFTAGIIDVRRYARFTPYARIAFRLFAAGSVDGAALPPQRQRALGGEGTLPAFGLFQFDCAARATRVDLRSRDFFPHYGCDRAVMGQVEYQAGFPFVRRLGRALRLPIDLGQQVRWVAFLDAGRAWTERGSTGERDRGMPDLAADAGFGVRIGQIGLYWTLPLTDQGDGLNFFLRLGRRL